MRKCTPLLSFRARILGEEPPSLLCSPWEACAASMRSATMRTMGTRCMSKHSRKDVAQGSLSSLAALPPRRAFDGAAQQNSDYLIAGAARTRTAGKAAGPESGPCATCPSTSRSARAVAVRGRLAIPSVCITAEPRRVGQALPLPLLFSHGEEIRKLRH